VEVFRQDGSRVQRPHQKNSHASPTPITDGRHLYVHFGPQGTACLTLEGRILWKRILSYNPVHGNGGSPVLVDGAVVVICDGGSGPFVIALEQTTGKTRWKRPRPNDDTAKSFSFCTPLVIEVDGQTQVVCPGSDLVIAYDPRDGRELWQVEFDGYSVIPRPVFGHGLVFMSTGYNTPALLAVRPGHPHGRPAAIAWRRDRGAPHTPSPLLAGNELYFVSDRGIATCLDARSGNVHWQKRLGGNYSASPVFAAGRVFFQSEDGVTTVIEAGTGYREAAHNDLGERTLASPAIADSALFLRTQGHLYRIEEP
ncbi:MAG: PQQ-binding-like beta-propeller repeat protein, partial [Planctomycetaceae bacterium]